MAIIQVEKFNLNQFYEKTPKPLKYILVVSLIIATSYFLFSRKVTNGQELEISKIETTIETTYKLINKFENFQTTQYIYNEKVINYLENVYTLVKELNDNTNKKFNLILSAGEGNTQEIIERLFLLNESFEKLQKAYTPKELSEYQTNEQQTIDLKSSAIAIPINEDGTILGDTIYFNKK